MVDKQMTVTEHLEELRRRLFVTLLALLAGAGICWFWAPDLLSILLQPARAAGAGSIYLRPADLFWLYIRLAVIGGLILAAPVILYQLGAFVWPALERHERRLLLLALPAALALFAGGAVFAYFLLLPYVFRFLLSLSAPGVTANLAVDAYVSFVIGLILPFGFVFQLPVFVAGLTGAGLLSPVQLRRARKYAILVIAIVAAILTPPDPISQLAMGLPMLALYEASIVLSALMARHRKTEGEEKIPN